MTGAEVELAILVARGVVEAGSAIYQAIVGDEDPEELLARARAAGHELPVRTGPGGAWAADLDERLARGGGDDRPLSQRPPPGPPPNPFGEPTDFNGDPFPFTGPAPEMARRVIGCTGCGKPAALVGDLIPADGLCRWCRDPEGTVPA